MKSQFNASLLSFMQFYVRAAGLITVGVGVTVLAGWLFGIPIFKSFLPGIPAMRFNTALSFILLGSSIWLLQHEDVAFTRKRIGRILAGLVLLLCLLTLSEYMFRWNLGIDELFVRDLESAPELFPGRMSPFAVLFAGLSSISLLTLGSRASQGSALIVSILALLVIMNDLFGFQAFYLYPENQAVIHTITTFLIVSLGILAARPRRGMMAVLSSNLAGSKAMRRLFPIMIALTIPIGILVEEATNIGLLDTRKESIFLVIVLIIVYSPLIYYFAKTINQSEEQLMLSSQILQHVKALVVVADTQGEMVYVSPATKTILGYEAEELFGDNWWKLTRSDPTAAQREKEHVGQAARGEISIVTKPYMRPLQDRSGVTHWIEWVDAMGPGSVLIGVGQDVTERKQVEEALAGCQ